MQCPRCQHENPAGSNFCLGCGARIALVCTSCGTDLPAGSRFCNKCGAPVSAASPAQPRFTSPESYTPKHLAEKILTSKSALEGERKLVTVLFADLKGSMELLADRDPEEARKLLDPVLERMMEAVHRYEGTVNQVMGDGIMALFGAPVAHEDHAVRACYAALRMQEAVRRYAEDVQRAQGLPLHIRIGLNSGQVVVRSIASDLRMDYTAVGQTTHLAARMEQTAMPGSILMTAETLRAAEGYVQVRPLGPVHVKGLADPVEAFEVSGAGPARTRLQAAAARGLTRFVGRAGELDQLRQALERAWVGHGQVHAREERRDVGIGRRRQAVEHRPRGRSRPRVDAVKEQGVKVNIEIGGPTEALDGRDAAGARPDQAPPRGPAPELGLDWAARGVSFAQALAATFRRPWGWYLLIATIPLNVALGLGRTLTSAAQTERPVWVALFLLTGVALNAAWWIYFYRRRAMFGARLRWRRLEQALPIILGPDAYLGRHPAIAFPRVTLDRRCSSRRAIRDINASKEVVSSLWLKM